MKKSASKDSPKLLDYVVVFLAPLVAAFVTVFFNTSQVASLFFFFILPSLYLTYKRPSIFRKGILPVLASIPFVIIIDHFAIKDGSWWVYTIFPFRILDTIPVEDFIWSASWFYYIVAFYEYFIDRSKHGRDTAPSKRYMQPIIGWFTVGFVFLLFYDSIHTSIAIPYFYAIFALVLGLTPTIVFLIKYPRLLHKFVLVLLYFFFVNFLHEISALSTNQWYFPGNHFIGWVQIFRFRFPFEEFTLWMPLGSSYLLTWYEYFVDDRK